MSAYTISLWAQQIHELENLDPDLDCSISIGEGQGDDDRTISGERKDDGWEWFKLLRLGKTTLSRSSSTFDSVPSLGTCRSPNDPLLPRVTRQDHSQTLLNSSSHSDIDSTRRESAGFRSHSEPARQSRIPGRQRLYASPHVTMRTTNGSFDDPSGSRGNLIDLESGRNDMNPPTPTPTAGFSKRYNLETASELITPCPSISAGYSLQTDSDGGTETSTVKTAMASLSDVSRTTNWSAQSRDRGLISLSIILILIWTLLLSIPHPPSLSLSSPL